MLQSYFVLILELLVKRIVPVNVEVILDTVFWILVRHIILLSVFALVWWTVPMSIDDFLFSALTSSHSWTIVASGWLRSSLAVKLELFSDIGSNAPRRFYKQTCNLGCRILADICYLGAMFLRVLHCLIDSVAVWRKTHHKSNSLTVC